MYYKRVKSEGLSRDKVKLFVSFKQGFHRKISLPTISCWLKKTIVLCYSLTNDEDLVLAKVKAHQVRALAVSQAFYNNAPIESILEAGTWACHSTFLCLLPKESVRGYFFWLQIEPVRRCSFCSQTVILYCCCIFGLCFHFPILW